LNLKKLLRPGELRTDESVCKKYAGDKWFATYLPKPCVAAQHGRCFQILRFANEKQNSGDAARLGLRATSVGACRWRGGVVLSLERMKRIKEISADDFVAVVQPAVITKKLQDAVEAKVCSIRRPGQPRRVQPRRQHRDECRRAALFEVRRDARLRAGPRSCSPKRHLVRLGSRTHKNKSGFDLWRFFVGSEGMLGIITEAS